MITCKIKKLYIKLSQESQILNVQSIKGIHNFIYSSLGIFFLFRMLNNIIQEQYFYALGNGIGLLLPSFSKRFRNNKIVSYYILISIFWIASISYLSLAFFSNLSSEIKFRNIWVYESLFDQITPLLSLKYQIIQKIFFHILCGKYSISEQDDVSSLVLEYIIGTSLVIFNIKSIYLKNIHIEKEFQKKRFYEEILYRQPGFSYKLGKNSKDQVFIKESNNEKSYQQFIKNMTQKNLGIINQNFQIIIIILLEFEDQLPYKASNLFDALFKLIHEDDEKIQCFKFTAISNKGKPNQKKFKMLIMKQQENFQNFIFLRINQIDLEEQMELMKTRELMFNSINHDVKNPLIAGSYLINQVITQNLDGQNTNYDYLYQIQYNIDISLSLINGYFDYTLAQLGTLKIQPEKFNLYEPIMNTIKMMQHLAQKKSIHLISQFDIKKLYGKNDVRRLSQVLMNLINNAIKFTLKGGEVIVQVEEFICHNLIYITVTDTGVGMSPEILGKIGQLYATFNNQNMNSQGTGIGLYTSHKTVNLLGPLEKIFISSVEGQGSQFSFFIYLNVDDNQIQTRILRFNNDIKQILQNLRQHVFITDQKHDHTQICIPDEQFFKLKAKKQDYNQMVVKEFQSQCFSTKQLTIMVLDDDEFIRYATVNAIKNMGKEQFNIFEGDNGQVGLDLFKTHNKFMIKTTIDIIITDMQMPELNGYQMISQINELVEKNHYQKSQIIALTANQSNEFTQQIEDLGINQIYSKPQTAGQIREIIRNHQNQNKINQKQRSLSIK